MQPIDWSVPGGIFQMSLAVCECFKPINSSSVIETKKTLDSFTLRIDLAQGILDSCDFREAISKENLRTNPARNLWKFESLLTTLKYLFGLRTRDAPMKQINLISIHSIAGPLFNPQRPLDLPSCAPL